MKDMKIIKRSGQEVVFDKEKIADALRKANREVGERDRISEGALQAIVDASTEPSRAPRKRSTRLCVTSRPKSTTVGCQKLSLP